jgi:hypothetical protein
MEANATRLLEGARILTLRERLADLVCLTGL